MFIKDETYREIIRSVPIICVDGILKQDNKFLLIKRNDEPLKGSWWVPGGRVNIGEKVDDAFKRKLKEELSIKIKNNFMLMGIYEDFFEVSSFGSHLYHTVSFVYECCIDNLSIDLDSTSSEWKFHDDLPLRLKNKMRLINV